MTINVSLRGADGSFWDFQNGRVRLQGGVSGLNFPPVQRYTRDTAPRPGQRFIRAKASARTLLLPLMVGPVTSAADYLALDRALWAAFDYNEPSTLIVTDPVGGVRELTVRLLDDGEPEYTADPSEERLQFFVLRLIADDPFWRSTTFPRDFGGAGDNANFYGGPNGNGAAPDFYLGAANVLDAAEFTNPGDVELWPTYRIRGPFTYFRIALGSHELEASIKVTEGQELVIETSPLQQIAYVTDGTQTANVTRRLSKVGFAGIPPRRTTPISVQLTGTGSIQVAGAARFYKAW